jgi:nitrate reductase NapE component
MSETEALAAFYVAGVVVATIGGWVAAQKFSDQDQPAVRLVLWIVIAGVLWPVLLVGIVEMVGVRMLTKAVAPPRSARSVGGEEWPQARRTDPLCDCDALGDRSRGKASHSALCEGHGTFEQN